MKVAGLEGAELDYWVAKARGYTEAENCFGRKGWRDGGSGWFEFHPTKEWQHGGPLIEKYDITLESDLGGEWSAQTPSRINDLSWARGLGPTPLIAACRAVVASVYGEEVK